MSKSTPIILKTISIAGLIFAVILLILLSLYLWQLIKQPNEVNFENSDRQEILNNNNPDLE